MRRPISIALLVVAFLLAGCGASSGENSSTTDKDTSSDSSDSSDSSETTVAPEPVSSDDLESILPTASDIGDDYRQVDAEDDEDDEDDASDQAAEEAMADACPEAMEIEGFSSADEEPNEDEVSAKFETEDDRSMEISLDPTPDMTEDKFDEIVSALSSCDEITWEDEASGSVTMTLDAEPVDGLGDYGGAITSTVSMQLFGVPLEIDITSYMFVVNGVGVNVTAIGGLDPETFEPVPADSDLVPDLAAEMQTRVEGLTD